MNIVLYERALTGDKNTTTEALGKSIGFIWMYAITNPGVNALRGPVKTTNLIKTK